MRPEQVDRRRPSARPRRILTSLAVAALVAAPVLAAPSAAAADDAPSLQWTATLADRDLDRAGSNAAVRLDPGRGAAVSLDVVNRGNTPVTVRYVRVEGRVIGLPFFSYTTRIDLTLPPQRDDQRVFDLDLSDLGDQATGLIPSRITLLGPDRAVLGTKSFVVDVRGSALSVYGLFGLLVAVVTALIVLGLAIAVARRQLPANRWRRAMRFLPAGIGLGFVATFTLSATRVLSPSATAWVPLVLGCGAAAFILGYLSPGPDEEIDLRDGEPQQADWSRRAQRAAAGVAAGGTAALLAGGAADSDGPDGDPDPAGGSGAGTDAGAGHAGVPGQGGSTDQPGWFDPATGYDPSQPRQ